MATGSSKAASLNTELGLKALHEALYGIQLGLEKSEIDDIEAQKGDPGRYLLEILSICLKRAKPLTWNDIYNALKSKCVNESKLAEEIRAKYLLVSDSSDESKSKQEHESEGKEDAVLSRKEKKELSTKGRRKGGKHAHDREKRDKERRKGKNKKERFMKDESQSEPEEVVREKSKRKKKATHDKEESVKGYGDRDHYLDTEVCEKVRKRSKKHSKKREVYTESESEASSDEDEMSFEDDTSLKGSARRKLTKHKEAKIHLQKEHRKDGKKKDAKSRDIQYSDEEVSTKSAQKLKKLKKVETESEEESSFASSSDEEDIEVHKSTKKSKRTETKSVARTKDTAHYESEEKGKTSGKKRVSLKPKSATAKEASPCPEEYKDKGRKKAARVDERVGKSTDSSRETYHKARSKPPRKEKEGRDGKREVVSGEKAKKATAPPLERDLPSSEMAQTDSGDGESDESSEDENESEQQSSDEEETENDSTAEEKRSEKSRKSKEKATHPTTEMRKTKSQDDEKSRGVKGKKLSKAAGAPSKDDSHGDKEESDASRDQADQPKKRNRRRHRESSKSPIVRGGSSPSSSQEERKPGSRRQRRTPKHGGKYKRKEKKKRRETSSRSSDTDSSSPESEMLKNLTKSEKKKLKKVFKYSFGQLCSASFNPVETAIQLQKKGLISPGMMMDIIRSPESQQDKIIRLVCGLDNRIRSRPERLFGCIEVLLENDALQEVGREMLRQTGKPFTHQAQGMFVMMCISSSLQV